MRPGVSPAAFPVHDTGNRAERAVSSIMAGLFIVVYKSFDIPDAADSGAAADFNIFREDRAQVKKSEHTARGC